MHLNFVQVRYIIKSHYCDIIYAILFRFAFVRRENIIFCLALGKLYLLTHGSVLLNFFRHLLDLSEVTITFE